MSPLTSQKTPTHPHLVQPLLQGNTLTLSGSYETGDSVTATVNNVEITYVVTADDNTLDLIASGLANAINTNPNLVDAINAVAAGAEITITADTPGVPFSLPLPIPPLAVTQPLHHSTSQCLRRSPDLLRLHHLYRPRSHRYIRRPRSFSSAVDSTGASSPMP